MYVRLLLLALGLHFVSPAHAGAVRAATASNFVVTLHAIAQAFQRATGHEVDIMIGSTGVLYAQITQGAPIDVFFAADTARPEKLEEGGLIKPGSRATYARGQLSMWVPGSALTTTTPQNNVATLLRAHPNWRLAIANPGLAPYGAAAQQVMQSLGLPMTNAVCAQNIGQAYAYLSSGSAQAGFVARSQVYGRSLQGLWPVPSGLHDPIDQDMVILKRAARNTAAQALHAYMRSKAAVEILRSTGYLLPTDAS